MNWIARTLWDLIGKSAPPAPRDETSAQPPGRTGPGRMKSGAKKPSMQDRYDALVIEMKRTYGVRVRKWRKSSSGCAWQIKYDDGTQTRLIESPYPRGPMSCAIFLHEIGHHAIGFGTFRPRCLEEYHAWKWALDEMRRRNLNVTPAVERRMAESLQYAVAKATRRGMKRLPAELIEYTRPARTATPPVH